jgi:hypothetical protein
MSEEHTAYIFRFTSVSEESAASMFKKKLLCPKNDDRFTNVSQETVFSVFRV